MKIVLKTLTLQNFMSFGTKPTVVNLNTGLSTLIIGENKDVGREGQSRNGVGKSTIFQALMWVLFNEGIENIKQDQFINLTNKKKMVVTLNFEVDGVELELQRGRKPAVLSLTKDGEPYTMHSVATVDEAILNLIGMSYDTFTNTQLLSTNVTPFMAMKPAQQRDFVERMVGLDLLSKRAAVIKARQKNLVVDIKLEEQKIEHDTRSYTKIEERIVSLNMDREKFEKSRKAKLAEMKDQLKLLQDVDIDACRNINAELDKISELKKERRAELKRSIDEIQKQLDSMDEDFKRDYDSVMNKYKSQISDCHVEKVEEVAALREERAPEAKRLKGFVDQTEDEIDGLLNTYKLNEDAVKSSTDLAEELEKTIEANVLELTTLKAGECPYCGQEHFDDAKVKSLESKNKDLKLEFADAHVVIHDAEAQMSYLEKVTEKVHDTLTRTQKDQIDYEKETEEQVQQLEDKIDETILRLSGKQDEDLDVVEETFEQKTADLKKKLKEIKATDVDSEFEHDLKSEFTDEELAEIVKEMSMVEENIMEENARENPYDQLLIDVNEELIESEVDKSKLYEMKEKEDHFKILVKLLTENKSFVRKNLLDQYIPFINAKIATYSEKLDLPHEVEINNDLTTDITYMNQSVSYGNLSNGEKGRLNFATSMSFRDLMSVSGHSFNILMIDELLDNGIDTSGFHDIFRILKQKDGESMFLISHREDLITEVDNVLKVTKENGFTNLNMTSADWELL